MYLFTADSVTVNGKTFPAAYSITPTGAVVVFVQKEEGKEPIRIRFGLDHDDHTAALCAANAARKDPYPAATVNASSAVTKEPVTVEAPAASKKPTPPPTKKAPAADGKAARGPVPEKTFIGETIQGNGWKILFDGEKNRTRIIFDSNPTAAARAALDKAGFFFSTGMNSWNKKLTFRAYRAAKALSSELSALYA